MGNCFCRFQLWALGLSPVHFFMPTVWQCLQSTFPLHTWGWIANQLSSFKPIVRFARDVSVWLPISEPRFCLLIVNAEHDVSCAATTTHHKWHGGSLSDSAISFAKDWCVTILPKWLHHLRKASAYTSSTAPLFLNCARWQAFHSLLISIKAVDLNSGSHYAVGFSGRHRSDGILHHCDFDCELGNNSHPWLNCAGWKAPFLLCTRKSRPYFVLFCNVFISNHPSWNRQNNWWWPVYSGSRSCDLISNTVQRRLLSQRPMVGFGYKFLPNGGASFDFIRARSPSPLALPLTSKTTSELQMTADGMSDRSMR